MGKKITIKEEQATNPEVAATNQPQNISLDQKVDGFLLRYEREASPEASRLQTSTPFRKTPNLPEHLRLSLTSLLFEAEPDMDIGGGDEGPDMSGLGEEEPGSGGEEGETKVQQVPAPKMNTKVFAERVARLASNYESLLDPSTVILNRVNAYLTKNYNTEVAKEVMITLELAYGLSPKTMIEREPRQSPIEVGAGVGDLTGTVAPSGA